jgi:hypothetical protein
LPSGSLGGGIPYAGTARYTSSGADVVGAVVGVVAADPASYGALGELEEAHAVGCGITTLLLGVCAAGPSHAIASVAIAAAPATTASRRTPQKGHDFSLTLQCRWQLLHGVSVVIR